MRGRPGGSAERLVRAARAAGVHDPRLLDAMYRTPREEFVPAGHRSDAGRDEPVPISHGQVTSQPSLIAMMVAALGLAGDEHVLEVGTGFGYQTALLARLAADVVSIELWADMTAQARRALDAEGIRNVELVVGDGTRGVPSRAPYDAVIVCAAFPEVPPPLVEQLRIGGRLVQPIGPGGMEAVRRFERRDGGLGHPRTITSASFVRLYGEHGYARPCG